MIYFFAYHLENYFHEEVFIGLEKLILILVAAMVTGAAAIVVFLNKKKQHRNNENGHSLKGLVDRYGYCTKTPNGWGYWLLKMEGLNEPIIIWPHPNNNHNELALTKPGDCVEVSYFSKGSGPGRELIATQFKNLSF